MIKFFLAGLMGMSLCAPVLAQAQEHHIQSEDAHRFVAVFEAADGAPTAEALQAGYLDDAGLGVEIFTPNRIVDAETLARRIARFPDTYRRGIDVCLPIAESMSAELQVIYDQLATLYPGQALPEIYVVFGGNNSGGTAGPGAQVIGLEVICRITETDEDVRAFLRTFFAHEALHTFQTSYEELWEADPMLYLALIEGLADYTAWRVNNEIPMPDRHVWAMAQGEALWADFAADRAIVLNGIANGTGFDNRTEEMDAAFRRWFWNAGPEASERPGELGYWIGTQIIASYIEGAEDPDSALIELLDIKDPIAILQNTSYFEQAGGRP